MRFAGYKYCVDGKDPTLKGWDQRGILKRSTGDDTKWQSYDLDDCLETRLIMDLVGGEAKDPSQLGGLSPSYASSVVFNGMNKLRFRDPRIDPLYDSSAKEYWIGVAAYHDMASDEAAEHGHDIHRHSAWLHGEIQEIVAQIADLGDNPARVFLVNVTRAARFVRQRAKDLGLPEGSVFERKGEV